MLSILVVAALTVIVVGAWSIPELAAVARRGMRGGAVSRRLIEQVRQLQMRDPSS